MRRWMYSETGVALFFGLLAAMMFGFIPALRWVLT